MLGWSSGNSVYDDIIRKTQKDADWVDDERLKWIPQSGLKYLVLVRNNDARIYYYADLVGIVYIKVGYDENIQITHHCKWSRELKISNFGRKLT
ncbi:hypothetical protein F8M41_006150 [Gigaspora margarita]|uniref:Uncharacterized protein n=1 Tax=Gigaspora margarita TaxID=4874 RepID=A0A8H4EVH8_GIGMA|nr:hypothetical protein F8M41_006150 [Gigaspora margarita]